MNPLVVLDTSVAMSWVLPNEDLRASLNLRTRAIEQGTLRLLVPPIFWSEISNVLRMSIRRSRIDRPFAEQALDALQSFGIDEYDVMPKESISLAITTQTSAYDAQYLVLALRFSATLWTLDRRLGQVAKLHGIVIEPEGYGMAVATVKGRI